MSASVLLLPLAAVAVGILLPIQFSVNAQLAHNLGSPVAANIFSFGVGFLALLIVGACARSLPSFGVVRHLPLYMLVGGGLLGATFLTTSIVLTPILGTAAVLCLIMAGQLTAAVVLDHFGLIGLTVHEVSVGRLAGVVLVLIGAVMVRLL